MWGDMEGNSHFGEVEQQVDLREVKENELFIQFVENYEQAYAYCEKHSEPGRHIGYGFLLLNVVLYFKHPTLHFCQNSKACMKHLRCIVHICIMKSSLNKTVSMVAKKGLKQAVTSVHNALLHSYFTSMCYLTVIELYIKVK